MPGVTARRAQTVERLVDAAMAVFAERGVQGSSVERICERAGFTRGAFYSNFESVDELCLEVAQVEAERLSIAAEGAIRVGTRAPRGDDPVARAIAVFTAEGGGLGPLVNAELRLHAARRPQLRAQYLALHRQAQAHSAEMLVAGLAEIGMELTIDPQRAIELIGAVYEQTALLTVIGAGEESGETLGGSLTLMIGALVRPIAA